MRKTEGTWDTHKGPHRFREILAQILQPPAHQIDKNGQGTARVPKVTLLNPYLTISLQHHRFISSLRVLHKIHHSPSHPLHSELPNLFCPRRVTRGSLSNNSFFSKFSVFQMFHSSYNRVDTILTLIKLNENKRQPPPIHPPGSTHLLNTTMEGEELSRQEGRGEGKKSKK